MKLVEGMKQAHLRLLLADDELNVLYNQEVYAPEFTSKLVSCLLPESIDELIGKLLPAGVSDIKAVFTSLVSYRMHEVSLPQARFTVDEQRIILMTGLFSYSDGSGIGKAIRVANYEAAESVMGVKLGQW